MNKINFSTLAYLFIFTFLIGCNKNDNPLKQNAKEGGLIEVNTTTVVYFINTMTQEYDVELKYYQGQGSKINSIEVYKQFFTTDLLGDVVSSPKSLFKTLDLSAETDPGFITYPASFAQLAQGTTVNGVLIPQADTLLKPGFYWELTYVIKLDDGRSVIVNQNSVFLNSRFAGTYKVVDARYYRSAAPIVDYDESYWPSTVKVTALNATTFKMEAPCEPFGTNSIYFTIDDVSGTVQVLKSYAGSELTINSQKVATCSTEPGAFNNVPCSSSNIAIKMASSKDSLTITYGYVTPTGTVGPREFYQKMVKL